MINWLREDIIPTLLNALETTTKSAALLTTVTTIPWTYSALTIKVIILTSLRNLLTSVHSVMVAEDPHSLGDMLEDGGGDEAITIAMAVITDAISVLHSKENTMHVA